MNKEEIRELLLSVSDLANRWNYTTEHGVRKRIKFDKEFPKPIKVLYEKTFIYWLPDIEAYEKLRGEIDVSKNHYACYQTKEEWNKKTREERELQRGFKYSDYEWEEIKVMESPYVTFK